MSYCNQCGKQSLDGAKFCVHCGTGLAAPTANPDTHIFEAGKKSNRRGKIWLVAVAGVLVLGTAAYFLFFNKTETEKPPIADSPITTVVDQKTVPGEYPIASSRELKQEDILNMTADEMKTMRNEIYARHGYIFQNKEMMAHFSKMPWYKPTHSDVREMLSATEKKNIELIKEMERYNDDHGSDFGR
jgi:hypothetical protein